LPIETEILNRECKIYYTCPYMPSSHDLII
jgi:hypothetical protein